MIDNKNNKSVLNAWQRLLCFAGIAITSILISSCANTHHKGVQTESMPSSNYSYRVKSLVMHFTAVDYAKSVEFLVSDAGSVSSHYLIPKLDDDSYPHKQLKVFELVAEHERAWHAGVSYWQGRHGLNDSSIGIEIVNTPECFEAQVPAGFLAPKASCIYPDFEEEQIRLLIELSKGILARNPDITPTAVIGHSDIAPSRKNDPGPRFPWYRLYQAGIGAWYNNEDVGEYWQVFNQQLPSVALLQKALHIYGYNIAQTGVLDRQTQDVLGAFQMHFIPWQVNYQADASTAATVFALLKKYFASQATTLYEEYEEEQNTPQQPVVANNQLNMQFSVGPNNTYTHNRMQFIGQANSGSMLIQSEGVRSADVYINGQKLNLGSQWDEQQAKVYSIAKRTQFGLNTLKVDNIQGKNDAQLRISIGYPELNKELNKEPATSPQHTFDFSALDTLLENDVNNGFPGAAIAVIYRGRVVKRSAYGFAKKYDSQGKLLSQAQDMQSTTMFDLASNTKTFATTLAIMKLVDEGKLSLNAPIASYLEEYSGDGRDTRTIADLLTHASGYNAEFAFFKSDNPFGEHLFSQDRTLTQSLLLSKLPFASARRSEQRYSDINFLILGLLVERISQMPLDEYVETHIYAPLALENTMFNPLNKGKQAQQFAATEIQGNTRGGNIEFENIRRYVLQGEVHDEKAYYSMQGVSGHAGLFSNIDDLAVLAQMLLNGGGYGNTQIFSEHTLRRFVHPEFVKDSIGLGWRIAAQDTKWHFGPYASAQAYGHTGWTGTATVIDPALDLAVIYLTNKKHSPVSNNTLNFAGDAYSSAQYNNVMALVYEAILKKQ